MDESCTVSRMVLTLVYPWLALLLGLCAGLFSGEQEYYAFLKKNYFFGLSYATSTISVNLVYFSFNSIA